MNTFALLLFCVQACLVQNAFGQCLGGAELIAPGYGYAPFAGAYGYAAPAIAAPIAGAYGYAAPLAYEAAYGGEGVGDVAVAGQLPVAGTTLVAGRVPILGAVEFGGPVCAGGEVTIAGSCACGCNGAYLY